MGRLRVAFLTDKAAPAYVGGYEIRVYELARRLAPRYSVGILSCSPEDSGSGTGPRFRHVYSSAFQQFPTGERSRVHTTLCGLRTLGLGARLRTYDVVVVEAIPYVHLPGVAWSVRAGRPRLVLDVSEAWGEFRPTTTRLTPVEESLVPRFLRFGLDAASAIVAVSGATARSLERHYGVPRGAVRVVPNGVALPADGGTPPREPGYDFVTVARLVDHKRVADFVRALALLRDRDGWAGQAAVIGDGPLRGALERLSSELGLADRIHFLGFVRGPSKDAVVAGSRSFVLPSEREGFSIAALEAMSQGVPVIASRPPSDDVFGVGDLVEDGTTGMTYPTGDIPALAERLARVLGDPGTRERLATAARERARPFTWDSATERFAAVLEEVAAS